MNKTPRIAVIGAGYWGKNLVRNFWHLGVLGLICDNEQILLEQLQAQYPNVATATSPTEVVDHPDITGVVIATPAESHGSITRECLLAGKHVFVEKPLVLDETEAPALIALAEQQGLILMVGHLLQYHAAFIRLKKLVQAGELGRINYIYSNRLNLGKVRREENILWSFAPHDISMILALTGEMPSRITASGGNYLHRQIADVTTTNLTFPSGIRAHIFVSWLHPYKEQKLVIVGEKKMAVFDDVEPWESKLLLYPHEINWQDNIPTLTKFQAERIDITPTEPLQNECAHFIHCINNRERPLTDGHEGLRVLRVLKSCQLSLDQQGTPVNLPTAPETNPGNCQIHPTAEIDAGVKIAAGTQIWHFSHILTGSTIGARCHIGQNVVIGPAVNIGDHCKIQNNVSIYQGVTLEDEVFCGPSMVFTNVHNPRCHIPRKHEIRPTLVKKGATLGANCTILCGHTIGCHAFVGAGAVVTDDVPDYALVYGNPARVQGWMCRCGHRLDETLGCSRCGRQYQRNDNQTVTPA